MTIAPPAPHPSRAAARRGRARGWRVAAGALGLLALAAGPAWAAEGPRTRAPLAEVNGEAITAEEVDRGAGMELHRLQERIYQVRRQKLDALIAERLLAREAARRGVSVQALEAAEVTARAEPVTDPEVDAFYQGRKGSLKGEEAKVKEQIRGYLQARKAATRREAFVQSLRAQARVVSYLAAPAAFRVAVGGSEGAPARGPASAPVTIVEFSDFHCPYCKAVTPTLTQLLARYPDTVRLVYRDFPIDSLHPQARRAAEAARCAHDQGKFWTYHDLIFAGPPEADDARLTGYARQAGLDLPTFERCLASGTHTGAVQRDVEHARRLGVDGTPTFFINGQLLTGAQPLDAFTRLIDGELARKP